MNLTDDDKKLIATATEVFFRGANGQFIVFDLETNGLQGSEVLSISAQKCQVFRGRKIVTLDHYDRYYYPKGKYNWMAIKVNGLRKSKITELRGRATYPEHFLDDVESFTKWSEGVVCYVGHNLKFDMSFFPKEVTFERVFDTMTINKNICRLPVNAYGFKAPKLIEAAEHYDVDTSLGVLHTSSHDVEVTLSIFRAMYALT